MTPYFIDNPTDYVAHLCYDLNLQMFSNEKRSDKIGELGNHSDSRWPTRDKEVHYGKREGEYATNALPMT